jgi:nitrite reductase/ring-hydroxylating ferredoxin subunit/uncharacterized membrane protein
LSIGNNVALLRRMRSSAHIEGHPIHPMLVGFPFAYLVGSACIDVWARATNRPRWHQTASHMSLMGIGAALAAAVPGLIDYVFAVPPKSSARKRATSHMFANVSALGLFALARAGRQRDDRPAPWSIALELAGMSLMSAAGWMGGTLVFRNQIGVDHRYANAGTYRIEAAPASADTIDAASAEELKVGQMKLLRAGGRRVVLARTDHGYVAFDDRCTHKGGPLSDGALVCDTVQCPWHGSQFDVTTGQVKAGPATEPIVTYAVEERDGRVLVVGR